MTGSPSSGIPQELFDGISEMLLQGREVADVATALGQLIDSIAGGPEACKARDCRRYAIAVADQIEPEHVRDWALARGWYQIRAQEHNQMLRRIGGSDVRCLIPRRRGPGWPDDLCAAVLALAKEHGEPARDVLDTIRREYGGKQSHLTNDPET